MFRRVGRIAMLASVLAMCQGCASLPTTPTSPSTPPTPALPTSAQAGGTTVVAVQPPAAPCCPHPTLWEFLGGKGLVQAVGGGLTRLRNRLGSRFPGLEAKPPVLAITDPANSGPNAPPAVKAAAEAKAYEDQAAQKIKAIRYLATLGCTECFPDVEKGLLAALDDCTESVRYEAVLVIRELSGSPCAQCVNNRCCSNAIIKKLDAMANQMNDRGCNVEPSARVRRIARLGLAGCGPAVAQSTLPREGPPETLPDPTPNANAGSPAMPRPLSPMIAEQSVGMAGVPESQAAPHRSAVVAEVNGEPIFEYEILPALKNSVAGAEGDAALRRELMRVVDLKLLNQAARRAGFVGNAQHDVRQVSFDTHAGKNDIAVEWLAASIRVDSQVSRQELTAFYHQHRDSFQPPDEVKFEYLSASTEQFGSFEAAQRAIKYLSDKAQGRSASPPSGIDLSRVSTQVSGWTPRDIITSAELANSLFTMPVGTLSPILYDDVGPYIVRVLDRRRAPPVPLDQVSNEIEREIISRRRMEAERNYLEHLRREARVWTILDGPQRGAEFRRGP